MAAMLPTVAKLSLLQGSISSPSKTSNPYGVIAYGVGGEQLGDRACASHAGGPCPDPQVEVEMTHI